MVVVPRRQPLHSALPFSPANNGLKTDQWRSIWQGTASRNLNAHCAQQGTTPRVIERWFHSVRGPAGSSHASPPKWIKEKLVEGCHGCCSVRRATHFVKRKIMVEESFGLAVLAGKLPRHAHRRAAAL